MGRILALLLGAAVVFGLGYYTLKGASPLATNPDSQNAQQGLERVRDKAKQIEQDAQRRADETVQKSTGE